jgi:hypothetical protein
VWPSIFVALCFLIAAGWFFYLTGRRCSDRRSRRTMKFGRDIYAAVERHLKDNYVQARPFDRPGADPDTMFIRFSYGPNATVCITRVDWHLHERHYIIARDGWIARDGICRHRADRRWRYGTLTRRRCKKILAATTCQTYLPAMSRHKGDTPRSNHHTFVH